MPAQPTWFHRLNEILEEVRALRQAILDRQTIENLFQVGERRSRDLMKDLPGIRIGNAHAVDRLALIQKLERIAASEDYAHERVRKQRVGEHLEILKQQFGARNVRLPAAPDIKKRQLRGLPATIELRPGELRIQFSGAENLATQLFELSQAMANDWKAFQEAVEPGPDHK